MVHRQKQVQTHNNELIVVINVLDGPHIRHVNLRIEYAIRAEEEKHIYNNYLVADQYFNIFKPISHIP